VTRTGTGSKKAGERASAAVEFALVLPLVFIIALALIQVGLIVKDQLVVEEAARAGARQAAVSSDDGSARQAALDAAVSLDPNRLEVSVQRAGGGGEADSVIVTYHVPIAVPLVSWLFPSPVDLEATAVMRQEAG
jgi:Flp pilus assembly protein TadG